MYSLYICLVAFCWTAWILEDWILSQTTKKAVGNFQNNPSLGLFLCRSVLKGSLSPAPLPAPCNENHIASLGLQLPTPVLLRHLWKGLLTARKSHLCIDTYLCCTPKPPGVSRCLLVQIGMFRFAGPLPLPPEAFAFSYSHSALLQRQLALALVSVPERGSHAALDFLKGLVLVSLLSQKPFSCTRGALRGSVSSGASRRPCPVAVIFLLKRGVSLANKFSVTQIPVTEISLAIKIFS